MDLFSFILLKMVWFCLFISKNCLDILMFSSLCLPLLPCFLSFARISNPLCIFVISLGGMGLLNVWKMSLKCLLPQILYICKLLIAHVNVNRGQTSEGRTPGAVQERKPRALSVIGGALETAQRRFPDPRPASAPALGQACLLFATLASPLLPTFFHLWWLCSAEHLPSSLPPAHFPIWMQSLGPVSPLFLTSVGPGTEQRNLDV